MGLIYREDWVLFSQQSLSVGLQLGVGTCGTSPIHIGTSTIVTVLVFLNDRAVEILCVHLSCLTETTNISVDAQVLWFLQSCYPFYDSPWALDVGLCGECISWNWAPRPQLWALYFDQLSLAVMMLTCSKKKPLGWGVRAMLIRLEGSTDACPRLRQTEPGHKMNALDRAWRLDEVQTGKSQASWLDLANAENVWSKIIVNWSRVFAVPSLVYLFMKEDNFF